MAVQTFNDRSLDTAAFAAESVLPEENSFTILSSEIMLKGEYMRDGDDLIIRGDLGEEIRVEEYFSGDNPPTLETPYGAVVLPETVQKLLVNSDSIEVAGPAGSLSIPGLLGDPIGTIDELGGEGQATAKGADGVVRTLNEGDPIYQDDVIETVGRSFANLRMMDDTSFQLGKETRAIIESYNYTPGVESGAFEATVISGFFRYASGKLGGLDKGTHTTIKTPTAQIGVRGSEMEGIVEEDGSSTFVHKDGILDVSDANGRGTVTLDEPGMATAVSTKPGAPAAAFEAPESLLASFEEALPPPPDFVVTHDEEGDAEGEVELLDAAALGEGEAGEEEGGEDAESAVSEVEVPALAQEDMLKAIGELTQNSIPKAFNDLLSGDEGDVITGNLSLNDQMGDGRHNWRLSNPAEHGKVVLKADGTFSYTANDPDFNGQDSFTYIVRDADGDESTAQVFINLSPVNDVPQVVIDGQFAFTENSVFGGKIVVKDPDVALNGDYIKSATVTIRGALPGETLEYLQQGTGITGKYDAATGTLTLTGNAVLTLKDFQDALMAVVFKSESGDPGNNATREFSWSVTDSTGLQGYPVDALGAQKYFAVKIIPVNDLPEISGQTNPDPKPYAEGGKGVALFSTLSIDPVESGQNIAELVFSVSDVADGHAEKLIIGEDVVALDPKITPDNAAITVTAGADGKILVSISGDWTPQQASDLVKSIQYQNVNLMHTESSTRDISLHSITDSEGGVKLDTFTNNYADGRYTSTVRINPVDNAPTLEQKDQFTGNASFTENAAEATPLFAGVQFVASAIEPGQQLNELVLKVTNVLSKDQLVINGQEIVLDGTGPTTVTSVAKDTTVPVPEYGYLVELDTASRVATVTLTGTWDAADVQDLIQQIGYSNSGDDPAPWAGDGWGDTAHTVSIHSLQDSGAVNAATGDQNKGIFVDDKGMPIIQRTVDITAVDDPLSATPHRPPYKSYDSGKLSLFSGEIIKLSSGEESQHLTEITFKVTGVGTAVEKLWVNDSDVIALTKTASKQTLSDSKISYTVTPGAEEGDLLVTITRGTSGWSNSEAQTLLGKLAYEYAETDTSGVLSGNRTVALYEVKDAGGDSIGGANDDLGVKTTIEPTGNRVPTFSFTGTNSELDYYEIDPATVNTDTPTAGDAVQLFKGLTPSVDPVESDQGISKLVLQFTGLPKGVTGELDGDVLIFQNGDGTEAGKAQLWPDNSKSVTITLSNNQKVTVQYDVDYDGVTGTTKVTLSDNNSPWSEEVTNTLLKSLYFENNDSGKDPVEQGESPDRTFSLIEIHDSGEPAGILNTPAGETPLFSREINIVDFNQAPTLTADGFGSETNPVDYTQFGVGQQLFKEKNVGEGILADTVEGSQSFKELVLTIDGVGGKQLSGENAIGDGSNEWIKIGGRIISLVSSDVTNPMYAIDSAWGQGLVKIPMADSTKENHYTVEVTGKDATRTITIKDTVKADGTGNPLTEGDVNKLLEEMEYGLGSTGDVVTESGKRTVTLKSIQDSGADAANETVNDLAAGATNDKLNISAVIDVKVDADAGVTIVNKNTPYLVELDDTGNPQVATDNEGNKVNTTQAEKESQYFRYQEPVSSPDPSVSFSKETPGVLLGGAGKAEIVMRISGDTDIMVFDETKEFDLFSYETSGGWVKLKLTSLGGVKVYYDSASSEPTGTSDTFKEEVLLSSASDVLDGKNHDLGLFWDGSTGDFVFSVDGKEQETILGTLTESATDFLTLGGGVITIGTPGFTGTIYDVSIKTDELADRSGESGKAVHWDMDQIDTSVSVGTFTKSIDGSEVEIKPIGGIRESSDEDSPYVLSVVDTKENDAAVEVDTFLVKEAVDIPELGYLQNQYNNIGVLQIDLTGKTVDQTVQVSEQTLDPNDLLTLGVRTVEIFHDQDQIKLDLGNDALFVVSHEEGSPALPNESGGWALQSDDDNSLDTLHYKFTAPDDPTKVIDLYVEREIISS